MVPTRAGLVLCAALWAAGCGGTDSTTQAVDAGGSADVGVDASVAETTLADAEPETSAADTAKPSELCPDGLPRHVWQSAPAMAYHRGELAGDLTLPLVDGGEFHLAEVFDGCENFAFVVDSIPVSDLDLTSIWTKPKDIATLLKKSPKNVHWLFVSRASADDKAAASLDGMQQRVQEAMGTLTEEQQAWWQPRVHVVADRAAKFDGWLGKAFATHGKLGLGIDRQQRIRGFGLLADVARFKQALQAAQKWPWEANLAYAQYEVQWWNTRAKQDAAISAVPAKRIDVWNGEVLSQYAEATITLDTVGDLKQFDTLEIDIDMMCPNPEAPEPGNCGAWDYIASLSVYPKAGAEKPNERVEMARFITTYHRESHWTVDATPMLAELAGGGQRVVRWEYAPEWNKQPTATRLSLRFTNRGKGLRPTKAELLWTGGGFHSKFSAEHPDRTPKIPVGAKKVALWAIITGHGAAAGTQCAEFCNHEHKFSIGAQSWIKAHPAAQNQSGCIPEVANGMTPNQGGTWWFGRGGWCPGQQVEPWSVDLTAVAPAGSQPTIRYEGLLDGAPPPDGDANIAASVYLVSYE
jgi:hypothetical protein